VLEIVQKRLPVLVDNGRQVQSGLVLYLLNCLMYEGNLWEELFQRFQILHEFDHRVEVFLTHELDDPRLTLKHIELHFLLRVRRN
jgi:hypothetical protein